jgi:predicted nucleotide-binding protein (sugar kinase/HSP70/actin superfamily)
MKVGFPYMGDLQVPLAAVMSELGAEVVKPPRLDARVLAVGAQLSPEGMCIPFKATLGVMARNLELGADTLVYSTGYWSCRFGYYGLLQSAILRDLGYSFRRFELHGARLPQLVHELVALSDGNYARMAVRAVRAVRLGWNKSAAVDRVAARERWMRPRVARPCLVGAIVDRLRRDIVDARSVRAVCALRARADRELTAITVEDSRQPLRIRLVGESYCVLEPFINFDIVRRLGDLGVDVYPFETAHEWLGFHGPQLGRGQLRRLEQASAPWWRMCLGGEDQSALGWLVISAREGFDGVVHLHPFACMPSTSVLPSLERASTELGIPLLSLALDEQTSEAGMVTRLEAFVSLLERRRQRRRVTARPERTAQAGAVGR